MRWVSKAAVAALALAGAACGGRASTSSEQPSVRTSTPAVTSRPGTPAGPTSPPRHAAGLVDPSGVAFDARGDLWVANYRTPTLVMFAASDLRAGAAAVRPRVTITGLHGGNGLAFGPDGTLWVANYDDDTVAGYSPAELRRSGHPRPVVIRSVDRSLARPTTVGFDGHRNLWVPNQSTGRIAMYTPKQQRAGGALHPARTLTLPEAPFGNPSAISFDRSGGMWLAVYDDAQLFGFSPSQLTRSGTVEPHTKISLGTGASPLGLAIDRGGRFWAAISPTSSVVGLPASASSGHRVRPFAILRGHDLDEPHGIGFDGRGNLWVASFNDSILRYPAGSLSSSRPQPDLVIR